MKFVQDSLKVLLSLILLGAFCVNSTNGRANFQDSEANGRSAKIFADCRENVSANFHNIGKIALSISNVGNFGSGYFDNLGLGDFPSCVYPYPGNINHLFTGALWIGAVVGQDTLVSVGADGWSYNLELWPAPWPENEIITLSILNQADSNAISEQDFIATYVDTVTDPICVSNDPFDNRPHIPLNIKITQNSYAWSYSYAEDFILFDYQIKNIGANTLEDVYMGIYIDGDVGSRDEYDDARDDISGFRRSVPAVNGCPGTEWEDTINIAWIADNDGRTGALDQPCPAMASPHVTGVRVLQTPSDSLTYSFNWWVSNTNYAEDFGPRLSPSPEDPWHDFCGHLGTPRSDRNRYYIMSHEEFDYDQLFTAVNHYPDGWLPPPSGNLAANIADGFDTRFLLSFGPFSIQPGEILPITFAYVAGENFHTDCEAFGNLFDPNNPDAFNDYLNFEDFGKNAMWASWIYDNPGVDTDGDGYRGDYRLCGDDMIYYTGDGVPDFAGPAPPPAPDVRLDTDGNRIIVRWNGLTSETARDRFSGLADFEGYRVYRSLDSIANTFTLMSSYDFEDYYKYVWNQARQEWLVYNPPFSRIEISNLYGIDEPLDYPIGNPFSWGDSSFYFAAVDLNQSELTDTTRIHKLYPLQTYPTVLDPDSAAIYYPDELTGDGDFKYFEYQYIITSSLPETKYFIAVTAFDYGIPSMEISLLETKPLHSAKGITTPPTTDVEENADHRLPGEFRLYQNFPNPFNPTTLISFDLPRRTEVELKIYNLLGRTVRRINPGEKSCGSHTIIWDGTDENGRRLASGVYFYQIKAGGMMQSKKMILMK